MSTSLRLESGVNEPTDQHPIAFSALTMLVGCQEEHSACKNWVMRGWHGYLSGMRCKRFAYGPADTTATPSSLASLKSRMVLPFWCWVAYIVLKKTVKQVLVYVFSVHFQKNVCFSWNVEWAWRSERGCNGNIWLHGWWPQYSLAGPVP